MENNNEKISASEINKYCYCQYSWYYERFYGKKYIREKYKQRNEALGITYSTVDNFTKGIKFHDRYILKRKIKLFFKFVFLFFVIILFLWGLKLCGIL